MTKAELVERVAQAATLSRAEAESAVQTVLDSIMDALNRGEKIASRSRIRKRSPARNPSSQSVRFRAICSIHAEVGFIVVPAT